MPCNSFPSWKLSTTVSAVYDCPSLSNRAMTNSSFFLSASNVSFKERR